jgi:MoaA/NifB/PqqE/SkfB family radical SAM enzyme
MAHDLLQLDHDPTPQSPSHGVSAYDLAQLAFFCFGFPRNGFGSLDVTHRCNLRCRHCYYHEQEHPEELSIEGWVSKFEEIKRAIPRWEFPFFNCSWVGGEPLLRRELMARCMPYFRYNTIVTNGTIPLPDWPQANWYVSIDGDEETHDLLRDCKGSYQRARRNIVQNVHLGITVAYCITKANAHCLEQVVKDWYTAGAKHITFDFYTPIKGSKENHELWVSFSERDIILKKLIALRRIYRNFFVIPERVFTLMSTPYCQEVTNHCLLKTKSFAWDAAGRSKGKCVMGDKADCDRCGCVVPFYLSSLTNRRLILRDLRAKVRDLWPGNRFRYQP